MTAKGLLLAGAVLLGSASANAAPFGNAYFFGDSLTDCCVFGRYTNGNAPNWADQLPPQIGASYTATAQTNLAIGGAQSGNDNAVLSLQAAYGAQTGFLPQVSRFGAGGVTVGATDIAGIWIGTNDIWPSSYAATDTFPGNAATAINKPLGTQPSVAALTSYVTGNIQSGINQLKADGFRNVVLLSPYDLGQSAIEPNAAAAALATQYSNALVAAESQLYTPGVNTYFVDVESLLQQVQADPSAYGFLHTTAVDSCSASNCTSQPLSVQNTYIFNDVIHTTSAFDQLIANDAAAIINAGQTIPAPVPEPATAALALVGLAGLGVARRVRKVAA
jgi:outer membrane lipase/esterase